LSEDNQKFLARKPFKRSRRKELFAVLDRGRRVGCGDLLQALLNLLRLNIEGVKAALLRGHAFDHMRAENFHAASRVSFLDLFPVGVVVDGAVEVPVDGAAGEVVGSGDFAVGLEAGGIRVDLLVCADHEGNVPVVLARKFIQGQLLVDVGDLLHGDLSFERQGGEWGSVDRSNLRLGISAVGFEPNPGQL